MNLNELSEQLLLQVKLERPVHELIVQLQSAPPSQLYAQLREDDQKKAFWINVYNAWFQILRRDQGIAKPAIYREKLVAVAGLHLSLDEIEHGILRKYRIKWSGGYLANPFVPAQIRKLAVQARDYRIHFALNCGAVSCPPIAFYTPDQIDRQLDEATQSFLEMETEVHTERNEVQVTRLFQWFIGDFGGRAGIRKILREKLQIDTTGKKLLFREYDRREALGNFRFQQEGT